MPATLPGEVGACPEAAVASLRAEERNASTMAGRLVAAAILLGAISSLVQYLEAMILAVFAVFDALLWASTACSARSVRRSLRGQCHSVSAVSWKQWPYGRNYAIFPPTGDPTYDDPGLVVSFRTRHPLTTEGTLHVGSSRIWRGAAILGREGDVLAVGRGPRVSGGKNGLA
jgi:hypothetical protein